jgi:CO/xanthine dehydrogenase Mo-binding subunit
LLKLDCVETVLDQIAPIANAVAAATGQRLRDLP